MSSKQKLLEVSLEEFMVHGYKKTSLSIITGRLGISKPALYYYFPNKKALFLECIKTFFEGMSHEAMAYKLEGETTKEKLLNLVKSFAIPGSLGEIPEGFNHFYFVFDAIKNVPEVKDLYMSSSEGLLAKLQGVIEDGIREGEISQGIDIEAFLFEMGVLIEGFAISHYMGHLEENQDIIDRVFELVWRGII